MAEGATRLHAGRPRAREGAVVPVREQNIDGKGANGSGGCCGSTRVASHSLLTRASLAWQRVLGGPAEERNVGVVAHNAVNQALICTALGMGPHMFRRLLQSNAAYSGECARRAVAQPPLRMRNSRFQRHAPFVPSAGVHAERGPVRTAQRRAAEAESVPRPAVQAGERGAQVHCAGGAGTARGDGRQRARPRHGHPH